MLQSPLLLSAFKGHHRLFQKSEACLPDLPNELIGWCEDRSTAAINPNSLGLSPLLPDFTTELGCSKILAQWAINTLAGILLMKNKEIPQNRYPRD